MAERARFDERDAVNCSTAPMTVSYKLRDIAMAMPSTTPRLAQVSGAQHLVHRTSPVPPPQRPRQVVQAENSASWDEAQQQLLVTQAFLDG